MTVSIGEIPDDVGIDYDPDEEPASGVLAVKQRHEEDLMALPGVTGVGVGQNDIGDDAIVIYLEERSAAAQLPTEIDGYDVVVEVTGIIEAQ